MAYTSPVSELRFILDEIVDYGQVVATQRFEDASLDVVDAILTEAGKLSDEVIAPLNKVGDLHPARLENGVVRTSPGFDDGFRAIAEGGWVGMATDPEFGGMGLPNAVVSSVNDMMSGACLALQLNPLLTAGQLEALEAHASEEIQTLYIPKMASGEWTGTMNLTEAHAGTDVGALKTKAVDNGDGTFSITGQKIFITWGDHDVAENVCHLVLARLPDAPQGNKGISLFLVPKYLPDEKGNPGVANDLKVVSLEHKMGIHGSPTCVMAYEGAKGWMVGRENGGLAAMFTMMNNARLAVAVQGVGVAEAAYQYALEYAKERKQGRTARGETGTIVDHADVRRMLMKMKAEIFGARAIALACAVSGDLAKATGDDGHRARSALLTPIAKAHCTDVGMDVTSLGVQIHGGMGFIEETGAAQFMRDVRITPIYEGTNGIQAMDLVARKMADGGAAASDLLNEVVAFAGENPLAELSAPVKSAAERVLQTTQWMTQQSDFEDRFAGATSYLQAFARVLGAYYHLKAASAENGAGPRSDLARFYITRLLPEVYAGVSQAEAGADGVFALHVDAL